MPKVSVIIPVYNVDKYLPRCLDSLINQTLKDIEIICINDCSPDNSLKVLEEYQKKDDRIKIIDLKENQGAAVARNKALEVATGEYLGFVDPDDCVDLNFYETLYKETIEQKYDIVKGNLRRKDANSLDFVESKLNDEIIKHSNIMYCYTDWTSAIYNRNLIYNNKITFPIECRKGQDIVFLCRCVCNVKSYKIINNVYYNYIRREGSLENAKLDLPRAKSAIKACELICECLNENINNIDIEGYCNAYFKRLHRFIYLFYVNNTEENKKLTINALCEYYHLCKHQKKINEYFLEYKLDYLLDKICKQQKQEIYIELNKSDTYTHFNKVIFLQSLRKNVKKDMQHA